VMMAFDFVLSIWDRILSGEGVTGSISREVVTGGYRATVAVAYTGKITWQYSPRVWKGGRCMPAIRTSGL